MKFENILTKLQLRSERLRYNFRARRKLVELSEGADNTSLVEKNDILLFSTLRNERFRLPYFFDYYRRLGVNHFFIVDNDSTDGSKQYALEQPDTSVWSTAASYKRARYGMDWLNGLLSRYAHGHWVVVVDPDEFLVYPYMESRRLPALTAWLESCYLRSFGALLLDMYPDRPIDEAAYAPEQNPFDTLAYFDAANYTHHRNGRYRNLWIQGGPRQRVFFADKPELAPALNKIPLVKWQRGYAYVSSMHTLLPRGLNMVYTESGGEQACGVLLHAKFIDQFEHKAREECSRAQHYAASREYRMYAAKSDQRLNLWTPNSTRYEGWRQLEALGLLSAGTWA